MWKSALALLATAGVFALPAAASHATTDAKAKSPWQLVPKATLDVGGAMLALGWAENRFWFITTTNNFPILHSSRLAASRLTGFTQTRVPRDSIILYPIVEGELVVNGVNNADEHYTARLLANGGLGAMTTVPDDLLAQGKKVVPKLDGVSIAGGVRVGDRTIWALNGWPDYQNIGRGDFFLTCCTESGAATNLTRFIDPRTFSSALPPYIGRDTQGRVWLAWLDRKDYPRAVRGVPRILELDPSTLAPRSKALAIPGVLADRVELACATTCRLVAQTDRGDIVSWAPGERSPTRVASHAKHPYVKLATAPAWLIAAAYRSGDLVVGYHVSTFSRTGAQDEVRVVRGNARGAGARVVGGIPILNGWPPSALRPRFASPFPIYGTFAPSGLVVAAVFQYTPTPASPSPVVGAVVPLSR